MEEEAGEDLVLDPLNFTFMDFGESEHASWIKLLDCSAAHVMYVHVHVQSLQASEKDLEKNYDFLKFYVPAVLPQAQEVPNLGEHQATGLQLES